MDVRARKIKEYRIYDEGHTNCDRKEEEVLEAVHAQPYIGRGCEARSLAPKVYHRRWTVWVKGKQLGEVLAATEKAACLRAVQRFCISMEDQGELEVKRVREATI